jgi:hypothetical protein
MHHKCSSAIINSIGSFFSSNLQNIIVCDCEMSCSNSHGMWRSQVAIKYRVEDTELIKKYTDKYFSLSTSVIGGRTLPGRISPQPEISRSHNGCKNYMDIVIMLQLQISDGIWWIWWASGMLHTLHIFHVSTNLSQPRIWLNSLIIPWGSWTEYINHWGRPKINRHRYIHVVLTTYNKVPRPPNFNDHSWLSGVNLCRMGNIF